MGLERKTFIIKESSDFKLTKDGAVLDLTTKHIDKTCDALIKTQEGDKLVITDVSHETLRTLGYLFIESANLAAEELKGE